MNLVRPNVFVISKPQFLNDNVNKALLEMGFSENASSVFNEENSVGENLTGFAGKICYASYETGKNSNISKVSKDLPEYTRKILKQKHVSVLRHTNYTLLFTNVSRVLTAELNRHAAGVNPSETSLRYVNPTEGFSITSVPSLEILDTDSEDIKEKKLKTLDIITNLSTFSNRVYDDIVALWQSEEDSDFHKTKTITSLARRVIPLGVAVNIVVTANLLAWRNIFNQRINEAAEEEICVVMKKALQLLKEHEPTVFEDFDLSLEFPKSGYVREI